MSKDRFPENKEGKSGKGAKGSTQQIVLVALLILAVLVGYLYFFTGLIKQREQVSEAPSVQAPPVKKPLPPRPDTGDEKQANAAKPEEKQLEQEKVEKPAQTPALNQANPVPTQAKPAPVKEKPVAAPVAKPAAVPAQPPAGKAAKPETKPARIEQTKVTHALAPKAETPKAATEKPVAAATGAGKKASGPAGVPLRTVKQGAFVLLVGEYAKDRELKIAKEKLEKVGISQFETKKIKKTEIMHRIFLADFDDNHSADTELQKLKQLTDGAFSLKENGRFAVYAGSYLHEKGAIAEQKRLADKGVNLSIKKANVVMQINELTAGSYSSSEDARKEADRLKKQGIKVRVIETGNK
jgi:hypothetical protein